MRRAAARARIGLLLALVLAAASCGESPTGPAPRATTHRTVTVVVRDSLGALVPAVALFWTARFESAGVAETRFDDTNEEGASEQVLAEGPWLVTASAAMPARVSGASFIVAGSARAAADTQLVRMVLHTASRVSGVTTLAGRTEHSGTIVSSESGAFAVTDSSGAWALDGVPLGRWPLTMIHFGFATGLTEAVVTVPGSAVTVPATSLISSP